MVKLMRKNDRLSKYGEKLGISVTLYERYVLCYVSDLGSVSDGKCTS